MEIIEAEVCVDHIHMLVSIPLHISIAEYIRNQLEEDNASDQISFKEYVDPFTGAKNK